MAFLALLPRLQAELAEGWTAQVVYDRYCDRLKMSYPQFTRYVRRYVSGKEKTRKPQDRPETDHRPAAAAGTERRNPTAGNGPVGQPGFNYTATSNKDDLI